MNKSISIPLLISTILTLVVGFLDYKGWSVSAAALLSGPPPAIFEPKRDLYLTVFTQTFNIGAISALFIILANSEKSNAAAFGKVIRDNIGTVILALAINMVMSVLDMVSIFAKLLSKI